MIKPYNYGEMISPTFYQEDGKPFNGTQDEFNKAFPGGGMIKGYLCEEHGIIVLIRDGKIVGVGDAPYVF